MFNPPISPALILLYFLPRFQPLQALLSTHRGFLRWQGRSAGGVDNPDTSAVSAHSWRSVKWFGLSALQHPPPVQEGRTAMDSGCMQSIVHQNLIKPRALIEAGCVDIRCVHGDIHRYPVVPVEIRFKAKKHSVKAAVSSRLMHPLILGTDWPGFDKLVGQCVGVCWRLTGTWDMCAVLSRAGGAFTGGSASSRVWLHGRFSTRAGLWRYSTLCLRPSNKNWWSHGAPWCSVNVYTLFIVQGQTIQSEPWHSDRLNNYPVLGTEMPPGKSFPGGSL